MCLGFDKMEVKIKLTDVKTKMPTRATAGAAGWDVYAIEDKWIPAGLWAKINLGFALEIPKGWCALLLGRSGLLKDKGIAGQPGLIDHDYRGELGIILTNLSAEQFHVKKGHRIGQLLFVHNPELRFKETKELSTTVRGTSGFGSTGQ